ncbi:hypothetical protein ABW20_dc0104754 [Dactylellina cionopaga]|nr:hypothetical protein ABW20_dc0104754 [Dactylellina cionopaga]
MNFVSTALSVVVKALPIRLISNSTIGNQSDTIYRRHTSIRRVIQSQKPQAPKKFPNEALLGFVAPGSEGCLREKMRSSLAPLLNIRKNIKM